MQSADGTLIKRQTYWFDSLYRTQYTKWNEKFAKFKMQFWQFKHVYSFLLFVVNSKRFRVVKIVP